MKPFVFFGSSHVFVLGLILALAVTLVLAVNAKPVLQRVVRWCLAALLAANWSLWMLLLYENGWPEIGNELPLNLCDWASVATVLALLFPLQRLYELSYFWATGGTVQALLTPDCVYDFPNVQFILFFVFHGAIIVAVIFLTLGAGMRPFPASMLRVTFWTLLYAAMAGAADILLGSNYAFLRAKPAHPSLLDFMAPWPWYIPELVFAGVLSMLFWYSPFAVADIVSNGTLRWDADFSREP